MSSRKPMFADGTIVRDYEPLFKYWELARKINEDLVSKAMLTNEDFNYLRNLVEHERMSLVELMNVLKYRFRSRVDGKVAKKALRLTRGIELDEEDARDYIAGILAGWLIEAGRLWRIIEFKGARLPLTN